MRKTTVPTLFLCLAATAASAQMTNQGAVMEEAPARTAPGALSAPLGDAEFVRRAITASRFEVEEAQLALAQGSDPRLKEFARTMVWDQGAGINAISRKKGADFDQQYRADQRQAHDDAIALLVTYQQSSRSEQLRARAIKMLPVVRKHREAIGALNTQ